MQACLKRGNEKRKENLETTMKALFLSMALAAGLAVWGSEPRAGVDQLMEISRIAGEQVYNILH